MFSLDEIIIRSSVLSNRRLTSEFSVPKGLRKYIKQKEMFAEYDVDIAADKSILNIPLLATILPLAWLTGSNIYVDVLDRTFKESMDELQREFKKMYPEIPFNTSINTDMLVENKIENGTLNRTALLFSGGVDSTYSLITNIDLKPRLIMIWGIDNFEYPQHAEYWEKTIQTYEEFAKSIGLSFHLIKTNISQILSNRRLQHDFHDLLINRWLQHDFHDLLIYKLRFTLQHSLVLLPLTAPLSIGRFDKLLIAATYDQTANESRPIPYVSRPSTDEKIVWADLKVKHDGYIPRPEKIMSVIKEYSKTDKLVLRVCHRTIDAIARNQNKLNDSSCEKCFRTIAVLVLAGINPNDCGFEVDNSTFTQMKYYLEERARVSNVGYFWSQVKSSIPEKLDNDLYDSKEFFEWFKGFNFDLAPYQRAREKHKTYIDRYYRLPYSLAKVLDIFYKIKGINIH